MVSYMDTLTPNPTFDTATTTAAIPTATESDAIVTVASTTTPAYQERLTLDGLDVASLPDDVTLLPSYIYELLNVDARGIWRSLSTPASRVKLLNRSERDMARKAETLRRRIEREQVCAEYIDALCKLPHVAPEFKEAARADFLEKRERYFALKGAKSN